MKLSIITINYNGAQGLKKTFDSIFSQTSKDFEYIVIDGGSSDGSLELIISNKEKITRYLSEKDNGIYNAMNKGVQNASGDYILFINSGDCLVNKDVIKMFLSLPVTEDIVYGNLILANDEQTVWVPSEKLSFDFFVNQTIAHPASFIKKQLFATVGLYDESLKICADWKFFMDAFCKHKCSFKKIDLLVAEFDTNGVSSDPKHASIVQNERVKVLVNEYPLFLYERYKYNVSIVDHLKTSRLFNFLKRIGLFPHIVVNE